MIFKMQIDYNTKTFNLDESVQEWIIFRPICIGQYMQDIRA